MDLAKMDNKARLGKRAKSTDLDLLTTVGEDNVDEEEKEDNMT